MTYNPAEVNPMAPHASTLVEGFACRIAASAAEIRALLEGIPRGEVGRTPTADAPLVLLADDLDLAERLRTAGVRVPRPAGSYAERQWDAREAMETTIHRMFDHGEIGSGVTGWSALEHRTEVVTVLDAGRVRALLATLAVEVARGGLVLDARDPRDLRAFALASLEHGRCIFVHTDRVEAIAGANLEAALRTLVPD